MQINTWCSGLGNQRRSEKYALKAEFVAEAKLLLRRSYAQVIAATMPEHKAEVLYILGELKNAHTYQVMIASGLGYLKCMRVLNALKDSGKINRVDGTNRGAKTVVWSASLNDTKLKSTVESIENGN